LIQEKFQRFVITCFSQVILTLGLVQVMNKQEKWSPKPKENKKNKKTSTMDWKIRHFTNYSKETN